MSHSVFPRRPLQEIERDATLPGEENADKRMGAIYAALYNESDKCFVDLLCKSFDAAPDLESRTILSELYHEFMQVSGSTYGADLIISKFRKASQTDNRYIEIIESLVDLSSRIAKRDPSLFYHSKVDYL